MRFEDVHSYELTKEDWESFLTPEELRPVGLVQTLANVGVVPVVTKIHWGMA